MRSRCTAVQTKRLRDNALDTAVGVPSRKSNKELGTKSSITLQTAVNTQRNKKTKIDFVTKEGRKA